MRQGQGIRAAFQALSAGPCPQYSSSIATLRAPRSARSPAFSSTSTSTSSPKTDPPRPSIRDRRAASASRRLESVDAIILPQAVARDEGVVRLPLSPPLPLPRLALPRLSD